MRWARIESYLVDLILAFGFCVAVALVALGDLPAFRATGFGHSNYCFHKLMTRVLGACKSVCKASGKGQGLHGVLALCIDHRETKLETFTANTTRFVALRWHVIGAEQRGMQSCATGRSQAEHRQARQSARGGREG